MKGTTLNDLDIMPIRASVTAHLRAKCADMLYRHAIEQGINTDNLPDLIDALMQRENTLELIERLVEHQTRQIH